MYAVSANIQSFLNVRNVCIYIHELNESYAGFFLPIYFILLVFIGAYFIINLLLSVVFIKFEQMKEEQAEMEKQELSDL